MSPSESWHAVLPWLKLAMCPGVGALSAARLIAVYHHPHAIFSAPSSELADFLGSHKKAQALKAQADAEETAYLRAVRAWLQGEAQHSVSRAVITWADEQYPEALKAIDDPPVVLYALGSQKWLQPTLACTENRATAMTNAETPWWKAARAWLAVVGSRKPTAQGITHAFEWSQVLQEKGVGIISGLAAGIDGAAHRGALAAEQDMGPRTIAVLGTGIDRVYPASHASLFAQIIQHGLVLTEQPLGTAPLATNFPKRNRIITGLAQATLVIEATEKSGTLVSARLAAEQGRDVMAIPGSVLSPQSKGCHALIKQGALLVESANDVFEELRLQPVSSSKPMLSQALENDTKHSVLSGQSKGAISAVSSNQQVKNAMTDHATSALLDALGYDPIDLDTLCARTGMTASKVQSQLLELELLDQVARLPGGWFQRIRLT